MFMNIVSITSVPLKNKRLLCLFQGIGRASHAKERSVKPRRKERSFGPFPLETIGFIRALVWMLDCPAAIFETKLSL